MPGYIPNITSGQHGGAIFKHEQSSTGVPSALQVLQRLADAQSSSPYGTRPCTGPLDAPCGGPVIKQKKESVSMNPNLTSPDAQLCHLPNQAPA